MQSSRGNTSQVTSDDGSVPLRLSPAEMRSLGYQVIDAIVDHVERLSEEPVASVVDRAALEQALREPLPVSPADPETVLRDALDTVLGTIAHHDHPRFFAFVPSPSNYVSTLADALTSGFNVFAGTWMGAPGATEVELVTIDWLRQICGLPPGAGGLYISSGSMANLVGLAAARHRHLGDRIEGAVIYASDQTHSSVERALRVLGFAPEQLRSLPADGHFRLPVRAVEQAIEADRAAGRTPFCVVANAGTTNTGAVDPLDEIADLCARENLWFHADGAYGAAAALSPEGRDLLRGLERVDSLALDPHKWLFQPYECGCVLVRDMEWLRQTFAVHADYLQDVEASGEINLCDYGIQLTRTFRALKLWMSVKVFGADAFAAAITRGIELAERAETLLRASPCWQILTPAQLGIVTFRYRPDGRSNEAIDDLNTRLITALHDTGFAMISSTVLQGRTVLRMCTINPRTTETDLAETIALLERLTATLER